LNNHRVNLHTQVSGWFKIEVIRGDGSKKLLADWFPNLILNQGLNQMAQGTSWLAACQVGSGSTVPAITDTGLVTRIAGTTTRTSTANGVTSVPPYYAYRTTTYRFATGVAAGNISEVGIGLSATTATLTSRALILDGDGNPATLTILDTETLDVTYQFRYYVPTEDLTGEILLRDTLHSWTARAANCISASSWNLSTNTGILTEGYAVTAPTAYLEDIRDITTIPLTSIGNASIAASAYAPNSFYIDHTITASLAQWNNAAGIKSISVRKGLGMYQIGFTPNIMKVAEDVLVLVLRHSWGRKVL